MPTVRASVEKRMVGKTSLNLPMGGLYAKLGDREN